MATTSQTLPNYQPAGESLSTNPIPEAVPISSSGSIGPFFAVISVLTILAFLSCVLGRILTRDQVVLIPLEGIRDQRSCFAWLKRKCRFRCLSGDHCPHPDVEVGSTKVKVLVLMPALQVEQLNQLRAIFARFDMDSDGSLTILELGALLRSLGLRPSGDQMHVLLSNIDANGNGSVEFDELVKAILPDLNEEIFINQQQLMEVFQSFDRDGNGYITAAELAKSMAKMGQPLSYKELTEMIKEADTDGDGVISFNEFATIMAKSASGYLGLGLS
ncbi:hypothetical protein ACLB2K_052007 [Fragaria x ananassa]